ncbi:MAG: PAS domain S-box protein [Syntrophobacteraceae bacterium]
MTHKPSYEELEQRIKELEKEALMRKRTEDELLEARHRLELAAASGKLGIWDWNIQENILQWNDRMFELYGITRDTFAGCVEAWSNSLHPHDRAIALEAAHAAVDGEKDFDTEFRVQRPDGTVKTLKANAVVIRDHAGKALRMIGLNRDMTERKRLETLLDQSRREWEGIFQAIGHPAMILDREHNIVQANQAVLTATGKSKDEVVGKKCFDVFHAAQAPPHTCPMERFLSDGSPETVEMELEALEGIFLVSCTPVVDDEGHTRGIIHMATDITGRKRVEQALQESQQILQSVLDTIPVRVFWKDLDSNFLGCNRPFALDAGFQSPGEIVGRNDFEMSWAEHADLYRSDDRLLMETGIAKLGYEEPLTTLGGDGIWLRTSKVPLFDVKGEVKGVLGTYEDITVHKRAEDELRLSERRLRKAEVTARFGNWEFILGSDKVKSSEGAKIIYGLKGSEWSIPEVQSIPLPEYRDMLDMALDGLIKEGKPYDVEFKIRRLTDGKIVDIHSIAEYSPEAGVVFGVIHDITGRKRAEEALRESEERYRNISSSISDFAFSCIKPPDGDYVINWLAGAVETITGYSIREVLDNRCWRFLVHPEDEAIFDKNVLGLEPGSSGQCEMRIIHRDGSTRWIRAASRVAESTGRPGSHYLFGSCEDITARKHSEAEISRLYRQNQLVLDATEEAIIGLDLTGKITFVNRSAAQMLGYSVEELIGEGLHELAHHTTPNGALYPLSECPMSESIRLGVASRVRNEVLWKKDGTSFPSAYSSTPITEFGKVIGAVVTFRDITERKRVEEERKKLEAQLFQAQKMESVGRLAGGVAHDFNNMLGVIIGRAEMALDINISTDKLRRNLHEILKAAERSADLTRQLLAFARKQTAVPKIVDLNDTIPVTLKMLRRLIGEDIDLLWIPGLDLWKVKIDPSQVDQVLANLAVNARDAISGVGAITMRTDNVVIDDSNGGETPEFVPGDYVLLSVSDTGAGMSKEVLEKIFEPFFTTKELGKGTGLGLSTVYGIVKQNDGFIYIASQPGKGTTFKVYLPRVEAETAQVPAQGVAPKRSRGTETILVVEDDEAILNLAKLILENLGYTVLAARTPIHAIQLVEEHPGDFHLLITDVVMPGMNGRQLVERLRTIRPALKCLYMSGYTADVIAHRGVLDKGVNFIQKPFGCDDLAASVRQVLDHSE